KGRRCGPGARERVEHIALLDLLPALKAVHLMEIMPQVEGDPAPGCKRADAALMPVVAFNGIARGRKEMPDPAPVGVVSRMLDLKTGSPIARASCSTGSFALL